MRNKNCITINCKIKQDLKMKSLLILTSCAWILIAIANSCGFNTAKNETDKDYGFRIERPEFTEKVFLVTDYGAVNDGVTLNTDFINRAIRECSESGGGKVIIPEGVWITGPIQLMSHVNLYIDKGAVVMFSRNFNDYPYVSTYFEGKRDFRAMPLLFGDSVENIAITGKGIFDGSGDAWRPAKKNKLTSSQWEELLKSGGVVNNTGDTWWPNQYAYEASLEPDECRNKIANNEEMNNYKAFFRPPLLQLVGCNKVLIDGPMFQNSPAWCIHPLMCTNLTVNDISVKNPWYAQNGDGIDIESCKYVSVENSKFDVGDDAICLKSGKDKEGRKRAKPTQYVVVSNCVVHHGHGGFVVGSEMSGGVRDIWVRNCTFTGTDVGLRFKSARGRGGVVENIRIENIQMINILRDAIVINLFYNGLGPVETEDDHELGLNTIGPEVNEGTPEFRNITISNVNCQGAVRAMQIMGLPEMPVSGIKLEKSVFTSEMGIDCLFARELSIKDVIVITNNHPSFTFINVDKAEISSCKGNNGVFLTIDGSGSKDIVVKTENIEELSKKLKLGALVEPDVVAFRNPDILK
jgi:polygalacturonase